MFGVYDHTDIKELTSSCQGFTDMTANRLVFCSWGEGMSGLEMYGSPGIFILNYPSDDIHTDNLSNTGMGLQQIANR